jgi:hypothetical protein
MIRFIGVAHPLIPPSIIGSPPVVSCSGRARRPEELGRGEPYARRPRPSLATLSRTRLILSIICVVRSLSQSERV